MKNYMKFICAILMLLGTSAHAWGTGIYLKYNGTTYYTGSTITIEKPIGTDPIFGHDDFRMGNDAGWTMDGYSYGWINMTISGTYTPSNISYLAGSYAPNFVSHPSGSSYSNANETSYDGFNTSYQYGYLDFAIGWYFDTKQDHTATITVTQTGNDGVADQTATFTITYKLVTGYTITYHLTGFEDPTGENPTAILSGSTYFNASFNVQTGNGYGAPYSGHVTMGVWDDDVVFNDGTLHDCYYNYGDFQWAVTSVTGDIDVYLTATRACTEQDVLVADAGAAESKTCNYGTVSSFTLLYLSDGSGSVTWTSSNTDVATVLGDGSDGATVTIVGVGSTDIKASVAADATYCAGEDIFPLTVNAVAPTVNNTNFSISSTTSTSATFVGGQVSNKGGADITTHGYVVGTTSAVTWVSGRVSEAGSNSDPGLNTNFTTMTTVTALSGGTSYYVRPFAYNGSQFGYGTAFAFTTPYAVSFDGNGSDGGDVPATVYVANGGTTNLPAQGTMTRNGYLFDGWAEGSTSGTVRSPGYTHTVSANITFYAKWHAVEYTNATFSCADWTLTGPSGDIVFITSAASKTVRSQEKFRIQGDGLPANTELTFAISPLSSKFAIMKSDGTIPSTNEYGAVDADVYVFYTPDAGDTGDGLDEFTSLTVSVTGEPRTATIDTKRVIGRHIATNFVIAGKKNNKWYALPANMSGTTNPNPTEIAVDNMDNPSIAYTANTNIFNLYGQVSETINGEPGKLYTNGETVKFGMKNNASYPDYPLFGSATGTSTIGRGGTATSVTNNIGQQYWWTLTQTATSITNPQDAKYTIKCSNNTQTLSIKENPFQWGLYASGVEELRLIPASNIPFTEAYFVEWGQYGGVIEVDATGISATKVQAKLNGNESLVKTLSQTLTSGKSRASIYNYTLNFNDLGNVIDFSAAASNGALLTLDWYNSSDVLVAKTTMVVPKIIASSSDMKTLMSGDAQWETEVHVLPGVTLTANGGSFESSDVRINLLEIYPGAIVKVTTGTLNVASLVLRNGWTRAGTKKFDVARLHIASIANLTKANNTDGWYSDWYVDYDQYYSISVPWEVTLANVKYRYCSVEPTVGGDDGNIRLRYYDGEQRASTAQSQIGKNWKDYGKTGNKAVPSKLLPSMGYAMNAKRPSGKAFSIIRMPMDFPGNEWTALGEKGEVSSIHKDQVNVTGWGYGTSTPWYAMGWNFIGNPYMCEFSGNDDGIIGKMELQNGGSIRYATIPDEGFKNFDQVNIATEPLKPASGFFIQANSASEETITFNASKIVPPSAPERYMTQTEAIPEQEAYIRLSYEGGRDIMGLIIGEDYTEVYEPNADLAKVLGDEGYVKTYMRYGDLDMAYVAINSMLAKEWIPVTVKIPADGEYTFSLTNSSIVDALEGVYLIDYANGDQVTNLIEDDYIFVAEAGTISGRFAINALVGEHKTPTGIDAVQAGADMNSDKPFKFVYLDKVYILHRGVIYDSTGKKVREINK